MLQGLVCYRFIFHLNCALTDRLSIFFRADASARVTNVKGNRHRSYNHYEEALDAWRQNCRATHHHDVAFVDGTVYSRPQAVEIPQPVNPPPSQHNVVFLPSTPTANRQGPTSTPGSPMKTSKASSSREKSRSASRQPVPDAHLWAVHTRQFIGVAST